MKYVASLFLLMNVVAVNYAMEISPAQPNKLPLIDYLTNKQTAIREEILAMHITSIPESDKKIIFFLDAAAYQYKEIEKTIRKNEEFVMVKTKQNYSPLGLATIFLKANEYQERREYIQKLKNLGIKETNEDKELAFIDWWHNHASGKIPSDVQKTIQNITLENKAEISQNNTRIELLLPFIIDLLLLSIKEKPLL